MKARKPSAPRPFARKQSTHQPRHFIFCEKSSGTVRFEVPAEADGSLPLEQAASLLAVHCLTRHQSPADYLVMVGAEKNFVQRVISRANQLLRAVWVADSTTSLSRRQKQVLEGVLGNLTNKEIAASLNLSERTVKFHVSALLAKYGVGDRVSLMRQAPSSLLNLSGNGSGTPSAGWLALGPGANLDRRSRGAPTRLPIARNRVVRFPHPQALA